MVKRNSRLAKIEKNERKILTELKRVEREEKKIESHIDFRSVHKIQVARAFVGSTLGIVLSSFLFGSEIVNSLSFNSAAILFLFSIFSAGYVSYKTEKGILSHNMRFSIKHTANDIVLYLAVAFLVSFMLLYAFGVLPATLVEIIKTLLIYSLPAVAGALTLTLI